MANDFEEQRKRLLGHSLPELASRIALTDPHRLATDWEKYSATSASYDLIQKQIDLARTTDYATKLASYDVAGINSARSFAEQALTTSRDWARLSSPDDALWSARSIIDRYQTQGDAIQKLLGFSNYNSLSTTAAELHSRVDRSDAFTRSMIAPLDDLRAAGAFDRINSAASVEVSKLLTTYESRFRVPTTADIAGLADISTRVNSFASMFDTQIAASLTRIDTPFVKIAEPAFSVSAFAELQGMSHAVASLAPFETALTTGLRSNLGDWRDVTIPTTSRLTDIAVRSEFYVGRGLKSELTDFPAEAFELALEEVSISGDALEIVEVYGEPIEPAIGEDASAFARTNLAHMWLLRFETQIREFIDRLMTAEFGADWPRHQLPNGMYDKWLDKQSKSQKAGMPARPVIVFADFTDYEPIISKRDNWRAFQGYFVDIADVRESLRRMQLPRIEAMHARPLSLDDTLFLHLEIKRLSRAFKKH